jgi:formylglycine-generating enzyme required for sulfatase activity/uncharacterized caspase-like protein
MERAIIRFGDELEHGGVGLFYFAGHGVQVGGRNYMVPLDAQIRREEEVRVESVEIDYVLVRMAQNRQGVNLIILDACRDNPFARSFRSALSGLAPMDAPSGTLIAYATGPGRVAEDGPLANGVYTGALVEHLATSGLKVEDVFKRVRVAVEEATGGKQVPWELSALKGDFYFAGRPAQAGVGEDKTMPSSEALQRLDEERRRLTEELARLEAERRKMTDSGQVEAELNRLVEQRAKVEAERKRLEDRRRQAEEKARAEAEQKRQREEKSRAEAERQRREEVAVQARRARGEASLDQAEEKLKVGDLVAARSFLAAAEKNLPTQDEKVTGLKAAVARAEQSAALASQVEAALQAKQFDQALALLKQAITHAPDDARWPDLAGRIAEGQFQERQAAAAKLLAEAQEAAGAKRFEAAKELIAQAERLIPDSKAVAGAKKGLAEARAQNRQARGADLLAQAQVAAEAKDLDQAEALLAQAGQVLGQSPEVGRLKSRLERLAQTTPRRGAQTFVNTIGVHFVLIPAGTFWMGQPVKMGALPNEQPRHKVTITKPFWLGVHELTQGQWRKLLDKNPSSSQGDDRPVNNFSWTELNQFLAKLNQAEGTAKYRLPTEAEWEYACRAGTETDFTFGNDDQELGQYAWLLFSSLSFGAMPVGQKKPNAWGLYDIHGNVQELCSDWYGEDYYAQSPETDPQGPPSGEAKVARGGSYLESSKGLRCTTRVMGNPRGNLGFRLVRESD